MVNRISSGLVKLLLGGAAFLALGGCNNSLGNSPPTTPTVVYTAGRGYGVKGIIVLPSGRLFVYEQSMDGRKPTDRITLVDLKSKEIKDLLHNDGREESYALRPARLLEGVEGLGEKGNLGVLVTRIGEPIYAQTRPGDEIYSKSLDTTFISSQTDGPKTDCPWKYWGDIKVQFPEREVRKTLESLAGKGLPRNASIPEGSSPGNSGLFTFYNRDGIWTAEKNPDGTYTFNRAVGYNMGERGRPPAFGLESSTGKIYYSLPTREDCSRVYELNIRGKDGK